jgi:hypothetical protein
MTDFNDDQRAIAEECDAIKAMLLEKNANYGNSALDPVRVFSKASPVEQILVRLDDKLSRLARGKEADEDVIRDILGYLVLLRIAKKKLTPADVLERMRPRQNDVPPEVEAHFKHVPFKRMADQSEADVLRLATEYAEMRGTYAKCNVEQKEEELVEAVERMLANRTEVTVHIADSHDAPAEKRRPSNVYIGTPQQIAEQILDEKQQSRTVHIADSEDAPVCGFTGACDVTLDPEAATCIACKRIYDEEKSK